MDPVNPAISADESETEAVQTEGTPAAEESEVGTVAVEEVPCLTTEDLSVLVDVSKGDPLTFVLLLGALILSGTLFKSLGEQRRLKRELLSRTQEVRALKESE
jgi:hypothetical protein